MPGHRPMTAVSRRTDGAAPGCGLWVPRSLAPTAAATPRTRLRTRSARSGAVPFFQLWPALLDPALDGRVIAFGRSAGRSLPTPVQAVAQDVPDVGWVVGHTGQPLDHLSHALQGPQVVEIPVGFGTFGQFDRDQGELVAAQLRQSSSSPCAAQTISTIPSPRPAPVRNDLMRDPHLAGNLGGNDTFLKQVRGAHAPLLHGGKIASRPNTPHPRPTHPLLYRNTGHPSVSHQPHPHR